MYIAMEYFSRGDLGKHVSSFGPLEEAKAADVARQILQGVFVLHKLGISHRDIKPEVCPVPPPSPSLQVCTHRRSDTRMRTSWLHRWTRW